MLRSLVFLLLAANGLYFAWSQGHLAALGWAPARVQEPERVQSQIQPQALSLLSAKQARQLESAAKTPTQCLQSEVLTEAQAQALKVKIESATPSWPAGSWSLTAFTEAGSWMIYMGPYPGAEMLDKKRQELRRLNVKNEAIHPKSLGQGLLLASAGDKATLDAQLAALNRTGVRTARILPLRPQASGLVLRLPAMNDALKPLLVDIEPSLPSIDGSHLRQCPT
jgi:hypothetical protein